MKTFLLAVLLSLCSITGWSASYINYLMMNTAIKHTLEEHERQKKIRNNQAVDTGLEDVNRGKLSDFREQYRKVEARMNSLGLLIDAGVLATQAVPLVNSIKQSQEELIALLADNPGLLFTAAGMEQELAEKAVSILSYMAGILLTYGDINRMKPADRKMLLNFARDELRALDAQSYRLLASMQRSLQLKEKGLAEFGRWVNRERSLVNEIISNARRLS